VPDPYYGGEEGFAEVVEIVERNCRALLDDLLNDRT
jgi:protein-tyrosine-phosphatase